MKRKKNISQIKEQEKSTEKKKPKETKISNSPNKKFEELVIRMLTKSESGIEVLRTSTKS